MSTLLFWMTLLPVVFMLHDFEEIIMFRPWLRRNRHELKARFPRFEAFLTRRGLFDYSTSAFAVAVCHEFLLLSVVSYGALLTESYGWWFAAFMAFFLHLFVHVGQWIVYRKYVPVIVTSVLSLPYGFYTFGLFIEAAWLSVPEMIGWSVVGLVAMALSFPAAFFWASKFDAFERSEKINRRPTDIGGL